MKAYYDYMVNTAVLFGANISVARKDMDEVITFEMNLADTLFNNKLSIEEAQNKWPHIPLLYYINELGSPNFKISETQVVNIVSVEYMQSLEEYITTVRPRTQANYLMWRIVESAMVYLGEDAAKVLDAFKTQRFGKQAND